MIRALLSDQSLVVKYCLDILQHFLDSECSATLAPSSSLSSHHCRRSRVRPLRGHGLRGGGAAAHLQHLRRQLPGQGRQVRRHEEEELSPEEMTNKSVILFPISNICDHDGQYEYFCSVTLQVSDLGRVDDLGAPRLEGPLQ